MRRSLVIMLVVGSLLSTSALGAISTAAQSPSPPADPGTPETASTTVEPSPTATPTPRPTRPPDPNLCATREALAAPEQDPGSSPMPVVSPLPTSASMVPEPQPSLAVEEGYCISDLIATAAGPEGSVPKFMTRSGCAKPAKGAAARLEQELACLYALASEWRGAQAAWTGLVPEQQYEQIRRAYAYAVKKVGKQGKAYIDRGLEAFDTLPVPSSYEREIPSGLPRAASLKRLPVRQPDVVAMTRSLHDAWASTMVPILDGPYNSLPGGNYSYPAPFAGRGGTSAVGWCESVITQIVKESGDKVDPRIIAMECGRSAANIWLMYLSTGDKRFRDVTIGIQNMALDAMGARSGDPARAKLAKDYYFGNFECWLDPDVSVCPPRKFQTYDPYRQP